MQLIQADALPSLARAEAATRASLRIALVQHAWQVDPDALVAHLTAAVGQAAAAGARLVCLPELTLMRYPADQRAGGTPADGAEDLHDGPTMAFARAAAMKHGVCVHASLFQRSDDERDALGLNTAILVGPDGALLGATHKLHIPITEGYFEDTYFRGGPTDNPYPVYHPDALAGAAIGMPTCWDEWFPEVARAYSLAGAEVLVYPTAIGSEPDFPDFDTEPLWRQVIVANGITAGTFMVVPNRIGDEGRLAFYGSSFISDPYGRVLAHAPRDAEAVLVADLDLEQRRDWLTLFPFLATRRPDTYGALVAPVDRERPLGGTDAPS
ncbi:nitrilase-related carbon-nitrogen hydrolase [Salinisphaera sp. Q1T1-3]|uniref:nitrilase-related carbon-nitrogen hydrolase n=1 Tax=Salinisphaera sp. Q1T1-3 TaxID=2321229 RepID=UPI000E75E149|nr:nitrilase-related carbon-nitrogen hydrolase [Salinisphaera sp. Q1T1-3]RJS91983.1 hydrolase [Salinisphaera sp. Q1T1-3]